MSVIAPQTDEAYLKWLVQSVAIRGALETIFAP